MKVQFVFRQVGPDITVMDVTGRLTALGLTLGEVERAIKKRIEQGAKKLVLDLGKVDFVDSSGVGMLVVVASAMEQVGGRMVIAGAAGTLKRILEIVHLERTVRMYPDAASACAALSGGNCRLPIAD
ncbi:MAG: STAS domain-containing protein [Terriglobia bacterium]